MAADSAEFHKVDLKGKPAAKGNSSLDTSFKSTKGKESVKQTMGLEQLERPRFESNLCNGYTTDNESDNEELRPEELPVTKAARMAELFADELANTNQTQTDRTSEKLPREAAMTSSENDVESVYSDDSGMIVAEEVGMMDVQAAELSDEEFFDLSSEIDLQAKRDRFLDQASTIEAILERAPISLDATFNQDICDEIQIHALEIAAIFGDDFEKLRKKTLNLTSQNELQEDQLKKLYHAYRELKSHMTSVTGSFVKQNRRLHETISKSRTVENELQAAKESNEQIVKSSKWLSNKHSNTINFLHKKSEDMKAAHHLEIAHLKNEHEARCGQLEHRFCKDRVFANGILFSESEKVRKLEAELNDIEEHSTNQLDSLKSELLYLRGRSRIAEKQHKQDTEVLKDNAEKVFEDMRREKDTQIKLLEDALQDLTRLSTAERVDFKKYLQERDCWMRDHTLAWKAQIQTADADLRQSRLVHSNCEQRLHHLHDSEAKIETLGKENLALQNKLQLVQAEHEELAFKNQLNVQEREYFYERMDDLTAENEKIAELFLRQEEETRAYANTEASLLKLVRDLKLESDKMEAKCKATEQPEDTDDACDIDRRIRELRAPMVERRIVRKDE